MLDRAAGGWWGQLMIAIRSHARGDLEAARLGYLRSDQLSSTPWAARGLALLAASRDDHVSAAELYARAVAQAPTCLPLLVEATDQLLAAGRPAACLAMIDAAPEQIAVHGRVVLQRARALLADGQADAARALLEAGIEVPDLREGETLGGAVARRVRRPAAAVPLRLPDARGMTAPAFRCAMRQDHGGLSPEAGRHEVDAYVLHHSRENDRSAGPNP